MTGAPTGTGGGRSLRWRVTALTVVIMAVALLVIGTAIQVTITTQLRRDENSRLEDRVTRATVLLRAGTPATALPDQVDGQGIRARVVDATGRRLGGSSDTAVGTVDRPRSRPLERRVQLGDGLTLVLSVEPSESAVALRNLRTVMLISGAVGLVVTAFALLGGVRVALRPLESMTALARDIARGERGRRLRPARTNTELGRTAQAFDDMLDALETAQTRAEEAAREARRSEATTRRFLSDAAHELRTPITGVQSLAETLVRHPDGDLERRERIATTLVRETRRAGALVADMLELARVEGDPVLERRRVDLRGLAEVEAERVALVAPSVPRVSVEGPGGEVVAWADPARITQILANLLDNARRHSPPDGVVRLAVAVDDDRWTSVTVTDEGAGVPAAERERVFDRLVRLDDARGRDAGGAGLGLSIARALARAHGGDLVALAPLDGVGGRFRLTLPTAQAAPTAGLPRPAPVDRPGAGLR